MRRSVCLLWPLAALLLLLAAGCAAPGTEAPPAAGNRAGAGVAEPPGEGDAGGQGPQLTLTYTDPETGLTLGVPEGWFAYPVEDAVVAMISPAKGEEDFFRENLLVTADDQFPDPTLETYVEALEDEVRRRYPDTETLESGDITVAGIEGRWLVDRFTGPKGEARVYRVVLVRDGVAYVLHGTAPVWTFDAYRPVFEAVAQSAAWTAETSP
ncbi:hypothetical protein J2Z79_002489 [Symbiobacterium terraclitae]|uniref:Lipoprotein n=1 Tax=Symbiobacterium terraclitae TaxID=557451 RepID=A0ABS4JU55_9FIRM|nr:hypothetical protein [Symbiobacterium terraclitae]MBP2019073.1 hypothetical protein [Symbiobacterium terraclitae]